MSKEWRIWPEGGTAPFHEDEPIEIRFVNGERYWRHAGSLLTEHDPNGVDPHTAGAKLDAGKTRVWLCLAGFARALDEVAKVTTAGAIKYTPNGWAKVPDGEDRYMDAFGRHAISFGTGERVDAQTGCLHRAQMIWNLLAALELELREREAKATLKPVPETEDDLYARLHSLSKALEGSGRIDEHDYPDAYATVLDAMNFVRAS